MRRLWFSWAALALAPLSAAAHPHVFVDATIEVVFDAEGRAEALRIGWTYDDLFSLLIIEDRGLDPDHDGVLTPEAEAQLVGFDMKWEAGFAGDTYALLSGAALTLSGPQEWGASYAGGKITSTHLRRFATPVPMGATPLVIRIYDPGFYSAYTIAGPLQMTGRDDCRAAVVKPDTDAADQALLAALAAIPANVDLEMQYPEVGAAYAEEARVTCGG